MKKDDGIPRVIDALNALKEDTTVPRNIKLKIDQIITILSEPKDVSMRTNKALSELEEMSDDMNIQPYTRTQLWNIVSMLEAI